MVASRTPIEPVSNFTSILSVPALEPISLSHLCIRSITACLCPNRASTCQRATNIDILLDYGCAGLVGLDANLPPGTALSPAIPLKIQTYWPDEKLVSHVLTIG